jgi:hypothetical protein
MSISPFENHNGQVARLLLNFILLRSGYPLVVIKDNDKQEYLDCLTKDSIYFLRFVTAALLNSVNSYRVMTGERLDRNLPSIKFGHRLADFASEADF